VKAAQAIAKAVRPEKVILFGSYADGQPTQDSDVDFLVIHRAPTRPARLNVAYKAHDALSPRLFPVDIVVRSTKQIRDRVGHGDFFLDEITSRGQVLYER
jgi:predicted nucleotidyltransferase